MKARGRGLQSSFLPRRFFPTVVRRAKRRQRSRRRRRRDVFADLGWKQRWLVPRAVAERIGRHEVLKHYDAASNNLTFIIIAFIWLNLES